jgi:hypothetical protein
MSWIGISDGRRAVAAPLFNTGASGLLPIGSLVIETLFTARGGQPQIVLRMERTEDWYRKLVVRLRADGEVMVEHWQGTTITFARLHMTPAAQDATLRLTYSWHAPDRHGVLTVENLETGVLDQAWFEDPQPMPLDDIAALIDGACTEIDPTVAVLACSDEIESPGLSSGFEAGTLIGTSTGPRPIETLRPGDLVHTIERGLQPVRHVVCREVPALGSFAPVHLRAPYFGLQRDVCLSPDHRVLIAGADAEYLFGADAVLVEARHLATTVAGPRQLRGGTIRYVQVVMDAHDCLSVCGTWAESLYLRDTADYPARLAVSALTGVSVRDLPRHGQIAGPLLKNYEAMVLVSAMCA